MDQSADSKEAPKGVEELDTSGAAEQAAPEQSNDEKPTGNQESAEHKKLPAESAPGRLKRFLHLYRVKPKLLWPLTVLAVLFVVLGVPQTRYPVLGLALSKDYKVEVLDNTTGRPITNADIEVAGKKAKTDNKGQATLHARVGHTTLKVSKSYYKGYSQPVTVGLFVHSAPWKATLQATGRQVPVEIVNKITGKPVEDALIKVADAQARTDKNGKATVVVPVGKATLAGSVGGNGYNQANIKLKVTDQASAENTFQITPAGKVYFLSKLSGKIDVVKTDLDGSNRETVLAGTGSEDDTGTVLLASRDWKYLALLAKRDSNLPKLYLISTANDKLSTIDEGNASFDLIGWHNGYFAYIVNRNGVSNWQSNAVSIKSFNAQTGALTALDSTSASGTGNADAQYEAIFKSNAYLLGDSLVYTKTWYQYPGYLSVAGKKNTLNSVGLDGSNKKVISSLDANNSYFGSVAQGSPYELFVQVSGIDGSTSFYDLDSSGHYTKSTSITQDSFFKTYPTYLLSPSGKQVFWSEQRDGKNSLLVGDAEAENGKAVANLSDYNTYGWYTDGYLLVSKNSSELYIMPVGGGTALKVSDYHKPALSYIGYGGGYGGI
ncbi:MAG TPA: hypothetical protein VLG13_01085 [Patescibacteria group bacterium]|nr:hypothetical protein [Patescibacteria group bacterium]